MEDSTQLSSEHSENSAREKLSGYLGSQMKVVISDDRVLIGEFMCTDKDRNLILGNCDEYIPMSECILISSLCILQREKFIYFIYKRSVIHA